MYDKKNPAYFSNARIDISIFLPKNVERVLEVGCGTGETLSYLKSIYKNATAVGLELTESAAAIAAQKIESVKNIDIESYGGLTDLGKFDLILLLDVLEHLRDPWGVLRKLVDNNLSEGGAVITSIPNARNHVLFFQLLSGNFEYVESGVLDKTHLRFFTKKSMRKMIEDSGLSIVKCMPTNLNGRSRSSVFNRLTFGFFEDFLAVQYIIKSTKNSL
jgi:2-polyprenyl-3-methyl-5-hydroxy-6-metoxy-1,4-benzoquinol methylase